MTPEQSIETGTDAAPTARDARDQPLVDAPSGGRSDNLPGVPAEEPPKGGRFRRRTAGRLLGLLRPSKWLMAGVIAATCAFVVLNVGAPKVLGDATDVGALDPDLLRTGRAMVVVNPPRRGIGADLARCLEQSGASHVIYSSCNVDSLARDLALLPSYVTRRARLFDMFPQTAHVETVCELVTEAA